MTRPACARIDLRALQHNFSLVRQHAPRSRVMAVIKAGAYGHGLVPVAQALPGADAFAVVTPAAGIALREAGIDRRIVLLEGPFSADDMAIVAGYRLDIVVHDSAQIALLEQSVRQRLPDVWIKFDTGMHRLGFPPAQIAAVRARLQSINGIGTLRYMSHLSCADEPENGTTAEQQAQFTATLQDIDAERTLANSAAVVAWPDTLMEWVRPGIMLYGASPLQGSSAAEIGLQPVMTLMTRLVAVRDCLPGERVGYGGDWICRRRTRLGVAAIGYGDGYPRHAPSGTPVLVDGQPAELAGRVSMDLLCIDLGADSPAQAGAEVVLWGEGLPVDEIAACAGTIAYQLLCGVSGRVVREYRHVDGTAITS